VTLATEDHQLSYKSLIKQFSEHGDLVILGIKGSCKTTLLMNLARVLRSNQNNRVIILETFPKWIHSFDYCPFYTVKDSDVQASENYPYLDEGYSYILWNRDFILQNADKLEIALSENKDLIVLIEAEEMEKISWVMSHIIYHFYRIQYQRAKQNSLESVGEHIYILAEESHNLLDSTVIAKKTFNKLRKIQNEFRNLNMHLVCVALRLQDLSPKIRSKMTILLSQISLDDYQLKVRNLLRNSKYRELITELPKGSFVYPTTDQLLKVEPFQQQGKPYEWIYRPPQKPKPVGIIEKLIKAIRGD
jgi:energy-coupling factor transporter ATP-binding protein EcfA2